MPTITATSPSSSQLRHRVLVGAAAGAAILGLAACGSSSDSSVSTKPSTSVSAQAPTGAPAAAKAASNAKLGRILVDSSGNTLYTLTGADGKAVACTGQCVTFWPLALVNAGSSTDTQGLSTIAADGGKQLTYQGLPLYTFTQDAGPGSATGDGVSSFGGTWHVVKLGGSQTSSSDSSTTSTTKTGRYGY